MYKDALTRSRHKLRRKDSRAIFPRSFMRFDKRCFFWIVDVVVGGLEGRIATKMSSGMQLLQPQSVRCTGGGLVRHDAQVQGVLRRLHLII